MSIAFGADGLEHQVKHLKAQVAAKDAELNSLRNELHKKAEVLAAEKQAKDDALYQVQREAERADTAEKNLTSKTGDLATLRQQLYNLESSLKNSDEKLKKAEKENQRIQYDLDCSTSNNAEEATRRLQDEKLALQGRVKALEGTLRTKESEIDELRRDGGGSGWGAQGTSRSDKARMSALENEVTTLREENVKLKTAVPLPSSPARMKKSHTTANFFGNSFSPAPTSSKTRRRSTSLTDPRIAELEAEIQSLKSSGGGSDSDGLKVKLSAAITARDKLENQKLALEKASKREIGELRDQMESLKYEVEFYRANEESGGGGKAGKGDVERIKRELNGKIAELEERIRSKTEEVEALQRKLERLPELESELHQLRSVASTSNGPDNSAEIGKLERKIASLTCELETARLAPPTAATGPTALTKQIRQLQRDLDTVNRERDALKAAVEENDDLIAQKDEELLLLKRAIPMPGSPVLTATSAVDESVILDLRRQLTVVEEERAKLVLAKDDATDALAMQNTKIAALDAEVSGLRKELACAQSELTAVRTDLGTAHSARQDLQISLEEKERTLARHEDSVRNLSKQLDAAKATAEDLEISKQSLQAKEGELQAAVEGLETARDAVAALQAQRDQSSEEHAALSSNLKGLEEELEALKLEKGGSSAAVKRLKSQLATVTQNCQEEEATSAALRTELERESTALQAKAQAYEELEERYLKVEAQVAALEQQHTDLQNTIANRSTDSEARSRDVELLEWKERSSVLKKDLAAAQAEHERDMEEAAFLRKQDAIDAQRNAATHQTRISQLEARIATLSRDISAQTSLVQAHELRIAQLTALPSDETSPAHDEKRERQLLHVKIDQLRTQRDELRQRLSYLSHESRFALSAAEVDKVSALEDLQKVRSELLNNEEVYAKLQEELAASQTNLGEISARLTSVEASFASASSDKHDLADKIAQLESDLAKASKDRAEMDSVVQVYVGSSAKFEGQYRQAQIKLSKEQDTVKDLERRIEQLHAERKADAAGSLEPDVDGEQPRTRTTSGSLMSETERLNSRIEYLQSKLARQEDQAKIHRRELERARLNEKLGKDTIEENIEEIEELEGKVAALQTELAEKTSTLLVAEQSTKATAEELSVLTSELAGLRSDYETAKSNVAATSAQVIELDAARLALQSEVSILKGQEADLRQAMIDQQAEVKSLSSRIVDLQMVQDELQQKLDTGAKRELDLVQQMASVKATHLELQAAATSRIHTLETEISGLMEKLAETGASSSQVEAANEKITLLESQLADRDSEITKLQGELDALVADLAASDEAHSAALVRAKTEMALANDASAKQIADLTAQSSSLESTIAAKTSELDRLAPEMERLRDELANEQSISKKAAAEAAMQNGQITSLQLKVSDAKDALKEAQSGNAALQAKIALLQDSASVTTNSHQKLVIDLLASQKEKESLKARVDDLSAKLEEAVDLKTHQEGLAASLKKNLESAEETAKRNASLLKYHENEAKSGTKATKMLQEQLIAAQKTATAATDRLKEVQVELQTLSSECNKLKAELATGGGSSAGSAEVEELRETIHTLEESLNLKNQELDEADDRVRDAYTAKIKAEKKVAKLTRQLAAKETESQTAINTAMNAKLTAAPSATAAPATTPRSTVNVFAATPKTEMPPPSVPTAKSASVPASPSSHSSGRQALRAVNIFDRANTTSEKLQIAAGAKRLREDVVEEKLPAEAIMLPPVKLQPSPRRQQKAFAPSRTSVFAPKSPKENAFVSASPRAASENIFSRTPTHSRNAFSTSQLPSTSPFTR